MILPPPPIPGILGGMINIPTTAADRKILSVGELNRQARHQLESNFGLIWVEGELSNVARPGSGHWYFTLKDDQAQVRCAMFRMRNQRVNFQPKNGQQVMVCARVSIYEARGDYQLIAEQMEEAGDGLLRRRYEMLKARLADEGLFDEERKRDIPPVPKRIGVITSPTGAAIRDVLTVLQQRFPAIPVCIYPVQVQGEAAAPAIAEAIALANQRQECDVLLLTRGGGSLEDLWAFNEEVVARAIAAGEIPLVSAVGHEVDVTIADFVADLRAATPSAAAERISPDRREWWQRLSTLAHRLNNAHKRRMQTPADQLQQLHKRLQAQHPGRRLQDKAQRLDELEARLKQAARTLRQQKQARISTLQARLGQHNPKQRLKRYNDRLETLPKRLEQAIKHRLESQTQRLHSQAQTLHTVSPLATLERGYAIVGSEQQQIVRDAASLNPGDALQIRLAQGQIDCRVETIHEQGDS